MVLPPWAAQSVARTLTRRDRPLAHALGLPRPRAASVWLTFNPTPTQRLNATTHSPVARTSSNVPSRRRHHVTHLTLRWTLASPPPPLHHQLLSRVQVVVRIRQLRRHPNLPATPPVVANFDRSIPDLLSRPARRHWRRIRHHRAERRHRRRTRQTEETERCSQRRRMEEQEGRTQRRRERQRPERT